jgi:predicted metal-dependent HD superfamily phosphohydrolase
MTLSETFVALLKNYTKDEQLIASLWREIVAYYGAPQRNYHTLDHLENLLVQLNAIKEEIKNWNAILFTLYYHDIIYDVSKQNNEDESAHLAAKRMKEIAVSEDIVSICIEQIVATKLHLTSTDQDTNYFTDADLSILGQPWETYRDYYKNIRLEFQIYPDLHYNSGRKKALNHFLSMGRIFKTDYFYNRFEAQARINLKKEIELLHV